MGVMCTPLCPCDAAHQAVWAKYTKEQMSGDGRARAVSMDDLTADQKNKLGTAPNWDVLGAPLVPLHWKAADNNLNKKGGVFDNFKACYTTTLKGENKQDKANKEMNGDG